MRYATYYEKEEIIPKTEAEEMIMKLQEEDDTNPQESFRLEKYYYKSPVEEQGRITRYYVCKKDRGKDPVYLEKKITSGHVIFKQVERISLPEADRILKGEWEWMKRDIRPLVREFYLQLTVNQIAYMGMTEYTREIYSHGSEEFVVVNKRMRRLFRDMFVECLYEDDVQVSVCHFRNVPAIMKEIMEGIEAVPDGMVMA